MGLGDKIENMKDDMVGKGKDLWSSAESLIREDLRRFKRVQETGEIPTTDGQPQGNCKGS